jgi:nitrite reductase/ring-hydroxylating ferredoxin subunit
MVADWGALPPQLIISMIGIVGSVVILFLTNWYGESRVPNVNIILPISDYYDLVSGGSSERGHIILNLVNNGKQSANDIMFNFESFNNDIKNATKISGTERWNLLNSNSRLLVLNIPRLSTGEGSIITIDMQMKSNNTNTDYKASAAFDQGSTQVLSSRIWIDSLLFYIYKAFSFLIIPILAIIIGVIIYVVLYAYTEYTWPKQQEKRLFLRMLSNDIIGIRGNLRNNELNQAYIPTSNDWYSLGNEEKSKFLKTTEEYINIDDFYAKLKVRNSLITSMSDDELKKSNKECIILADKASKYVSLQKATLIESLLPIEGYQKVARRDDLQEGGLLRVQADEKEILLSMVEGKVYAVDILCTHQGGPLNNGELKGHNLKCPWHYAVFDVRNGKVSDSTVWATNLNSYPVKVAGNNIYVNLAKATKYKQ